MLDIPLVTEEYLDTQSKAEVIAIAMMLQQIVLVQDEQIDLMQKLANVHDALMLKKNREGKK